MTDIATKLDDDLIRLAPYSKTCLERVKLGEDFQIKITKPRNLPFHRKFFAMITHAIECQEEYTSDRQGKEDFLHDLKVAIGHCTWRKFRFGEFLVNVPRVKSISFARMDDLEFREFYSRAVDGILANNMTNASEDQLMHFLSFI